MRPGAERWITVLSRNGGGAMGGIGLGGWAEGEADGADGAADAGNIVVDHLLDDLVVLDLGSVALDGALGSGALGTAGALLRSCGATQGIVLRAERAKKWRGRRGSNPRPPT